ncbi:MAG TPA: hypothetical protein VNJ01_14430 [Bacteriovoracaceae bacterium]|nr:hypothetical protein [Bacteriovoracaceae bacterium]
MNKPRPGSGPTPSNPTPGPRNGTQAIANGDNEAIFQTYIFKLNPQIIVNDGVTLKGELSSGYIRGGFAGDNSANNLDGSGNNSYFFTTPAQSSALNVNQMYMELYADTALIRIGRMSRHYGLGMVFDSGTDPWDRFFTMYDGIEAEMKIGNFSLIPHYAKISSRNDGAEEGSPASGSFDVSELGVIAKYDNKNRDLVASVLYAKRSSERKNALYHATEPTTGSFNRGDTEVTVIEPFISKRWNKLKLSAEATLQSGEYGNVYDATISSKLNAQAFLLEAKYELNPKWETAILAGQVSGDDGSSNKFEATYLHPNFHIADLMFRYHYPSFNEGNKSVFDSSITNAQFLRIAGNYKTDKWTWRGAFIFATAMETAKAGLSYHHEENYRFNSTADQADELGYEFDFGFDYQWNPNVTIGGYYGYWFVGDYYAFSNDPAGELSIEDVHGGGLRATLEF